eukprot:SAG11_NODE_35650_length_265_cov_1.542169_1_plen_61_part_01
MGTPHQHPCRSELHDARTFHTSSSLNLKNPLEKLIPAGPEGTRLKLETANGERATCWQIAF